MKSLEWENNKARGLGYEYIIVKSYSQQQKFKVVVYWGNNNFRLLGYGEKKDCSRLAQQHLQDEFSGFVKY